MLPHASGLEILRELRVAKRTTPVLLLTALDAVDRRVRGLDNDADVDCESITAWIDQEIPAPLSPNETVSKP